MTTLNFCRKYKCSKCNDKKLICREQQSAFTAVVLNQKVISTPSSVIWATFIVNNNVYVSPTGGVTILYKPKNLYNIGIVAVNSLIQNVQLNIYINNSSIPTLTINVPSRTSLTYQTASPIQLQDGDVISVMTSLGLSSSPTNGTITTATAPVAPSLFESAIASALATALSPSPSPLELALSVATAPATAVAPLASAIVSALAGSTAPENAAFALLFASLLPAPLPPPTSSSSVIAPPEPAFIGTILSVLQLSITPVQG